MFKVSRITPLPEYESKVIVEEEVMELDEPARSSIVTPGEAIASSKEYMRCVTRCVLAAVPKAMYRCRYQVK